MHARTTHLLSLLVIGVLALGAGACSQGDDELVIYSGRGQNLVGPLLDSFAEEHDVPIAVRYAPSNELALLLEQEGEATDADVVYMQNPGAVAFLGERDLLAALSEDLLAEVEPAFRSENDRWVGITGRQRVLVYNQDLVDPDELPTSVHELTEVRFAGRVAVAPTNGSFQDFVSAMRLTHGDEATLEWLEGLVSNDVATYPNNNSIVEAVGRGEIEMGLVNHYYNHRFLAEDPSLPSRNHRFAPGGIGNLVITSSAGIVAGTDQRDRAEEFIDFLLSDEAQTYFSTQTFEYPLAASVDPSQDLPGLDPDTLPQVDIDRLGDALDGTVGLIQDSGLAG